MPWTQTDGGGWQRAELSDAKAQKKPPQKKPEQPPGSNLIPQTDAVYMNAPLRNFNRPQQRYSTKKI